MEDTPPTPDIRILSTLFDGVILSRFVNCAKKDWIDFRCINKPDLNKPYPLNKLAIEENISILLSSIKALGLSMDKYTHIKDWFHQKYHIRMLINLLQELAKHTIDKYCNLTKTPELMRLTKSNEDMDIVGHFSGDEWIPRWINYMLNKDIFDEINPDEFNKLFIKVLVTLDAKANTDYINNYKNYGDNVDDITTKLSNKEIAKLLISYSKKYFGINTLVENIDFENNNKYCQVCSIVNVHSCYIKCI